MIAALFDQDILKIMTLFSLAPGAKFSRDEIKQKTRMNNVNLDNSLTALLNSNILLKEKRRIYFNQEFLDILNTISEDHKKLKRIPLDVYFSILEIMHYLIKLKFLAAYLFGSYSKLTYAEKSDIDLAIIGDVLKPKDKKKISALIEKIHQRYGKEIQMHYFTNDFYKSKKDPLVAEILKNGVKLI